MDTLTLEKSVVKKISKNNTSKPTRSFIASARKVISTPWRFAIYKTIYRDDTLASKIFAVILLFFITLSSTAVILETVPELAIYQNFFENIMWVVTLIFSVEYILRIVCLPKPWRYVWSPLGILDFIAIFPVYLGLFDVLSISINYLLVIRLVRLFRLFNVFDLVQYTGEASILATALASSRHKIAIFLLSVMISVTIIGTLMYLVEGPEHGFDSIPKGVYWAIVTVTTVGYGDVAPQTGMGKALASLLMLLGFSTIVVPTSIVSAEIAQHRDDQIEQLSAKTCMGCGMHGHDIDAKYCKYCGTHLWDSDDDF